MDVGGHCGPCVELGTGSVNENPNHAEADNRRDGANGTAFAFFAGLAVHLDMLSAEIEIKNARFEFARFTEVTIALGAGYLAHSVRACGDNDGLADFHVFGDIDFKPIPSLDALGV